MAEEYVLELKGITKIFPGVKALNRVQFQLKPGEVHALMGENGANTTTGTGYEMDTIAMAVFGGISSMGGKGNLAGGIISAFAIVCLRIGLGQRNVHAQVVLLIVGALLIAAVALPNIIGSIRKAVKK